MSRGQATFERLPYGIDGYQLKPGMVMAVISSFEGTPPADTGTDLLIQTTGNVRYRPVGKKFGRDIFRIEGEGRIYITASAVAGSERYQSTAQIDGLVAKNHPKVSITMYQYYDTYYGRYNFSFRIYSAQATSGSLKVEQQRDNSLLATFTDKSGAKYTKIIAFDKSIEYVAGTTYFYSYNGENYSNGQLADGVMNPNGLTVGHIPASTPETYYVVSFAAKPL